MPNLDTLIAPPPPIRMDEDGVARVDGTRVRLETVLGAFQSGCGAEEILLKYPSLRLEDIYAIIAYYLWHRPEVDDYLNERRRHEEQALREIEADFPSNGVRERLWARHQNQP